MTNYVYFISLVFLFVQCTTDDNTQVMEDEKSSIEESNSNVVSKTSEITCPSCDHKKTETLPTDVCTIKYTCENCQTELTPNVGDCCVYCTYGTHKCPSMQDGK